MIRLNWNTGGAVLHRHHTKQSSSFLPRTALKSLFRTERTRPHLSSTLNRAPCLSLDLGPVHFRQLFNRRGFGVDRELHLAAALADNKGSLLCMPLALCPIYAVQRNTPVIRGIPNEIQRIPVTYHTVRVEHTYLFPP